MVTVQRHLREARRLLARDESLPTVHEARRHLQSVELILAHLASQTDEPNTATRLLTLRTELGSHLLAAEDCEDASVRPEVIGSVLRRAVDRLAETDEIDLQALTA